MHTSPLTIPTIETDRLTLRGHTLDDFDDCAAMWGDLQVTQYIGGRPSTREEAWARLLRGAGLWALLGFGYWIVRERDSGRFVGEVGFAEFKRDITPRVDGVPEMGWVLSPSAHGRGYATEAVRAALAWADRHLPARADGSHHPRRIAALISPENAPSLRVAEKNGFRQVARGTYKGEATLIFERPGGGA